MSCLVTGITNDWGWFIDLDNQSNSGYNHSHINIQDITFQPYHLSSPINDTNSKLSNSKLSNSKSSDNIYIPNMLFTQLVILFKSVCNILTK
jgi:hypothetical protein